MDLVDFVGLVSTGTIVLERGSDELLRWVLLRLSDGRQLLLAERTYRDGTKVLVEPTEEELQAARRDPWAAWSSERGELVEPLPQRRGLPRPRSDPFLTPESRLLRRLQRRRLLGAAMAQPPLCTRRYPDARHVGRGSKRHDHSGLLVCRSGEVGHRPVGSRETRLAETSRLSRQWSLRRRAMTMS